MPTISETTTGGPGLRVMAAIETRRLARHPAFLIGVVLAYGLTIYLFVTDDAPDLGDTLSMPVIAAFFMGLTALVAMARLTRSTEVTAEALGTAPGTEARQTQARRRLPAALRGGPRCPGRCPGPRRSPRWSASVVPSPPGRSGP